MAKEKPAPTAIDYFTVLLSPALIMGLVGSLVFFLLEIFYRADGEYKQRLQWVLFFYVFGIVLVGRISMDAEAGSRSLLYGLALALLTYFGMQLFVKYPESVRAFSFLANLVLVGAVWWSSHRLVWDCTHVDDDADASAQGLLQAAGFDEQASAVGTVERQRRMREAHSRGHVLGVWVVYFSLAALPIFGLGQSLLPVEDESRRQFTFWLMVVYVGCGLGLLLTTCFLGLRRYLRQRGTRMPGNLTAAWAGTGAGLLIVLLLLAALLPRPYAEFSWFTAPADSEKQKASQLAAKGDAPGKDRGKAGETQKEGQHDGDRADKDGQGRGKDKGAKGEKDGDKGRGQGEKNNSNQGERGEKQGREQGSNQAGPPPLHPSLSWLTQLAPWLKWLIFALLALLVLVVVVRQVIALLARSHEWASRWQQWWERLWAWWFGNTGERSETLDASEGHTAETPFSQFSNPFEDAQAEGLSGRELLRYTLAALEAWAREHGVPRRQDETALEHVNRLCEEYPALEAEARRFVMLYGRAEYGDGQLPRGALDTLRALWRLLQGTARVPATV